MGAIDCEKGMRRVVAPEDVFSRQASLSRQALNEPRSSRKSVHPADRFRWRDSVLLVLKPFSLPSAFFGSFLSSW